MKGRHQIMNAILNKNTIILGSPESFKVLLRELQAICLDVGIYSINSFGKRIQIDLPTIDFQNLCFINPCVFQTSHFHKVDASHLDLLNSEAGDKSLKLAEQIYFTNCQTPKITNSIPKGLCQT
eukprot:TRINITY_DN51549_c0_g1_i1.p3 TRINITY_DN51549_c0_g1~~TRINITY_DN51549_c0_g1_i1.p3  ORF type:complete len:134 (-),score=5.68 TRINITY_DN51549_c0_g1_i1:154-525(-)